MLEQDKKIDQEIHNFTSLKWFVFVLFGLFFIRLMGYYTDSIAYNKIILIVTFGVIIVGFLFYFINKNGILILNKPEIALFGFWLWTVLSNIFMLLTTRYNPLELVNSTTFYIAVYFLADMLMSKPFDLQALCKKIFQAELIFVIMFLLYKISGVKVNDASVNSIYFIVLLLPFSLISKNKKIQYLGICLVVICALLSEKRTAFLMVLTSLLFFIVCMLFSRKMATRKKIGMCISIICLFLMTWFIYNNAMQTLEIDTLGRLSSISEDGGSGRTDIWRVVKNGINEFSLKESIFGTGFNGVFRKTSLRTSAHNDFLEIWYDYGLIGLLLYLRFVGMIFIRSCKMLKHNYQMGVASLVAFIMFLYMSMFSHLIIYPTYFAYILIFWSVVANENNAY